MAVVGYWKEDSGYKRAWATAFFPFSPLIFVIFVCKNAPVHY
jgi:hypothetical protein